jgi:hypothetical protein
MSLTVPPQASASWSLLTARLAAETDPQRRRCLEVVARHIVAEVAGDLDALKKTLVDSPQYTFWGGDSPRCLSTMEEVEAFYVENMRMGKSRLSFDLTRVVVDDRTVITEGVFRHVVRGEFLPGRRLPDGGPLDPGTSYLTAYQALVIWPISPDGLIEGEQLYFGQPPHQVQRAVVEGEFPHLGLASS